jgi:ATP-dependent 26S proteasome regulatory subunit
MTTNCLEKLDTALLRKGRTDYVIELGQLVDTDIKRFVEYHYASDDDYSHLDFPVLPISGCDLQAIVLANKRDYNGFVQVLKNRMPEAA